MSTQILMPALSPTMEEGTLARWLVKEGDAVTSGDILAEIETDKATMELESIDEGRVGKLVVAEGTEGVLVNAVIAVLLSEGESADEIANIVEAGPAALVEVAETPPSDKPAPASVPFDAAPMEVVLPEGTQMVDLTVREALRDAMAEEMRLDQDVFLIGEEVAEYQGAYKISQGLLAEFGDKRVIDTPITEHGFAGIAVGAAFAGLKPIVEFMTFNFAMQAIDHLINSAAKTRYMSGGLVGCSIVFRGPNGPAARVAAQHSQCYAGWYGQIPGLKVVAPYSAADAKGLLKAAIRDPNPIIFLEHELLYGDTFAVPDMHDYIVPIGKASVKREGADVTLISFSATVGTALQAAEMLSGVGISAEVIDLRTIRPLDTQTLVNSIEKTNRAVVIEQGWATFGVTAELSAVLMEQAFDYLDAPIVRVAGKEVPMPYAANLEGLASVQPADIVEAAKAVTYRD